MITKLTWIEILFMYLLIVILMLKLQAYSLVISKECTFVILYILNYLNFKIIFIILMLKLSHFEKFAMVKFKNLKY